MTVLRLALSELKRMTSGRLSRLSILALTLVPMLYGAVYLYANWDPYSRLNQLKAAIVNEDRGATGSDETRLEVGEQVTQKLINTGTFDWVQLGSQQEADAGVADGKYSFALRIPSDFSASLASPADFKAARQAILGVTTNDANNYLLSSIVDKITTEVHGSVTREVGETTANQILTGYGTIHAQVVKAADGAEQLRDGVAQLGSGSSELAQGARQLVAGTGRLSAGLDQMAQQTAGLSTATTRLADGAQQIAHGNAQLNNKVQSMLSVLQGMDQHASAQLDALLQRLIESQTINDGQRQQIKQAIANDLKPVKDRLGADAADVQRLADGAQHVAGGARTLADSTPTLTSGIVQASAGANQLADGAQQLAGGLQQAAAGATQLADGSARLDSNLPRLADGSARLSEGVIELADQLRHGAGQIPNPDEAAKVNASKVIGDPVAVSSVAQTKAGSYGAGLAPFFLVLALWIGAFMLVQAMRPLTQRALASNASTWKVAFGGWLPFFTVSTAQALVLYLVVHFGLGLNPCHPWLTLGLLLLASMAFTALIQGIVALLGTPGKFVVLILLVLQLVSSGGTFPWQTTLEPLHTMHMILPMGYVVGGMRHLIYGASLDPLPAIVLALLGYTVFGLLLSVLAVRRHKFWTLKTLQPEIAI